VVLAMESLPSLPLSPHLLLSLPQSHLLVSLNLETLFTPITPIVNYIYNIYVATTSNIFAKNKNYYVNPSYKANIQATVNLGDSTPKVKTYLTSMLNVPSAYWIDVKGIKFIYIYIYVYEKITGY
jgi:hypothetical protein